MAGSVSGSSEGNGVKKASPPPPLRKERGVITEEGYGLNCLGEGEGYLIKL